MSEGAHGNRLDTGQIRGPIGDSRASQALGGFFPLFPSLLVLILPWLLNLVHAHIMDLSAIPTRPASSIDSKWAKWASEGYSSSDQGAGYSLSPRAIGSRCL